MVNVLLKLSRVVVKQMSSRLIMLELSFFCCSNFFPRCCRIFIIWSMTINNSLWVFVSFISKVGVLAFSKIDVIKASCLPCFKLEKTKSKVVSQRNCSGYYQKKIFFQTLIGQVLQQRHQTYQQVVRYFQIVKTQKWGIGYLQVSWINSKTESKDPSG